MSMLYIVNSQFYFIRNPQGKFYVRVKDIAEHLGYRRSSCTVKKYVRKRFDCKRYFDFQINCTKVPKNSLCLEYDGIHYMIDNSYGNEIAKLKLKLQLDKILKSIQQIPLPAFISNNKRYLVVVIIEKIVQVANNPKSQMGVKMVNSINNVNLESVNLPTEIEPTNQSIQMEIDVSNNQKEIPENIAISSGKIAENNKKHLINLPEEPQDLSKNSKGGI